MPPRNLIRNLTVGQVSRYIELLEKLNCDGFIHDLDDPCDRAIVDVTLSPEETLELLLLHDLPEAQERALENTQRVSTPALRAVS